MKTYELTDDQIDRIIGMVENSIGQSIRDAVLAVVGTTPAEATQGASPSPTKMPILPSASSLYWTLRQPPPMKHQHTCSHT